ncbi:MAG: Dabb family protein [Granulosicoccus sp.]
MIRHIVVTKFKPDITEERINNIYSDLSALIEWLAGAQGFCAGRSESPEQIERGYLHGLVIDFDSWDALQAYSENKELKALGARLVENAVGGLDGILVLDIET